MDTLETQNTVTPINCLKELFNSWKPTAVMGDLQVRTIQGPKGET